MEPMSGRAHPATASETTSGHGATVGAAGTLEAAGARSLPFVSVVLPIRNEAAHIEACLERILAQDYPLDRMEVLVVDGRSDDATVDVVRHVQERHPDASLRVLDNPDRIVPPALNVGIRAARGEVVVRMDGHSVPAPDYVSACVRALSESGAANVGGAVEAVGATPFGRAVAVATGHALGAGDARYRIGGGASDVDTVAFGAFRRDVFSKTGLFDESMVRNQDYEMNVRIRAAGERVRLDPSIRFTYTPRGTVRGLAKQYFEYGWWKVETLRRHPGSLRWRQAVPAAFVAAVVLGALLAPWWGVARWGLVAALAPYAAVVAIVSARLAPTAGDAGIARIAGAFAVIHGAWGFGFLTNVLTGGRFPRPAGPARVPPGPGATAPIEVEP